MAIVCQSVSQFRPATNSYDRKRKHFEMTGNIKATLTEVAPLLFSLILLFWSDAVKDLFHEGSQEGALIRRTELNFWAEIKQSWSIDFTIRAFRTRFQYTGKSAKHVQYVSLRKSLSMVNK